MNKIFKDITNQKFGKLTAIKPTKKRDKCRRIYWMCICDCGKIDYVIASHLITGGIKSCGCGRTIHDLSHHRLYRIWSGMKQRCLNSNNVSYPNYGKRGITVNNEWLKFEIFFKDMANGYKRGLQIDRTDNNGNYCKNNCRWVTPKQNANNRRNNLKNK